MLFGKYSVVSVFSKGALTIDQSVAKIPGIFGADIFVLIEAQIERARERGFHHVTAASETCNEEKRKKIKPKRLFGVIWSSE